MHKKIYFSIKNISRVKRQKQVESGAVIVGIDSQNTLIGGFWEKPFHLSSILIYASMTMRAARGAALELRRPPPRKPERFVFADAQAAHRDSPARARG